MASLCVISACSIREAEAERARLRVELEKEVNRTGPARETLRAYVERWIEDIAGRTRRSTAEHYARVLAHALLPQLGFTAEQALALSTAYGLTSLAGALPGVVVPWVRR